MVTFNIITFQIYLVQFKLQNINIKVGINIYSIQIIENIFTL